MLTINKLPGNIAGRLCVLFVLAGNSVFAQNLSEQKISLDVTSVPLADVLNLISRQSAIPFSYNPRKIPVDQKITVRAVDKPLNAVLIEIMQQTGLKYTLVENQIIITPDKKKEREKESFITLSGNVRNSGNGESLIGATIFLKELQAGTVSNGYGFYSITVPRGAYEVTTSFVGFKSLTNNLNIQTSTTNDVVLSEEVPLLKEIVVSSKPTDVVSEVQTSKTHMTPKAISERPALFGETDVVKSLESLPGIKLHSDGSTFYYVRGGNRDQNLILIDDAPIYNPSHMLGVFSTIIPDVVNDVTVYKGDMPASLGGRLSSVMSVRTKKGNDQHFQAWGSQGLISTKIGFEGPFRKDKSSFLVTGRLSNFSWLLKTGNPDIRDFYFYDLNGKTNFKLNDRNHIFFSFYAGGDNYFTTNSGIKWANNAGTFRWNHLINDRLFLNTTVSASAYDYFLFTDVASNTRWHSHISTVSMKNDFSYFFRPQNELTFGAGISGYNFNPGNIQSNNPTSQLPALSVRNSAELVLYGNHQIQVSHHWSANYGVRLTSWSNFGESFEFVFDANHNPIDTLRYKSGQRYKTYNNIEPRLNLNYLINENSSIKGGLSRNVQNVHLISNSISPFTSMEVWLPSSINIQPQISNQATFGYYRALPRLGISLVAESFYKKMLHQIDFTAHAETLLNPQIESQLRFGNATAYGVEFLAKKEEGRLRGWAGYSYSRAKRKFQDINNGLEYNAFYDRPHQINLVMSYDLSLRWNLGINWIYYTGAPFSSPTSFYNFNGQEVPIYGQKNNDRLPDYHRLDLSATVQLNKRTDKKFRHSLTISIYNAYDRKNALFINYNKTEVADGSFKIPSNLLDANRVTSQYYLFQFTPSFSYNVKFQ